MSKLTPKQSLALHLLSKNQASYGILDTTLNSLERRGLIERTGDWYHCLTDEGALVLRDIEQKSKAPQLDPYEAGP